MQRKLFIASLSLTLLMILLMAVVLPMASAQRGGVHPTRTLTTSPLPRPTLTQIAPATLQAASTYLMQTATALQATLSAAATNSPIIISTDDGGATISYSFPESTVSAAISAVFAAAGYPNATADLVPGGIVVTIPNITYGQWTGTMVATYTVGVDNGSITVTLVSITIAGHSVPTAAFEALTESLDSALNTLIAETSGATLTYTIDSIVITDTEMTVTMTLSYTGDVPTPDVTPAFTPKPRNR